MSHWPFSASVSSPSKRAPMSSVLIRTRKILLAIAASNEQQRFRHPMSCDMLKARGCRVECGSVMIHWNPCGLSGPSARNLLPIPQKARRNLMRMRRPCRAVGTQSPTPLPLPQGVRCRRPLPVLGAAVALVGVLAGFTSEGEGGHGIYRISKSMCPGFSKLGSNSCTSCTTSASSARTPASSRQSSNCSP